MKDLEYLPKYNMYNNINITIIIKCSETIKKNPTFVLNWYLKYKRRLTRFSSWAQNDLFKQAGKIINYLTHRRR